MALSYAGQSENPLLDEALAYAARGWHVFPLHAPGHDTPCDCGDAACRNEAKHPWTPNGFKNATINTDQIKTWWRKWPHANIGVACGASGLVVLDVDPRHGGDLALVELVRRYGLTNDQQALTPAMTALTSTLTSETGGGGEHYVYRLPDDVTIRNTTDLADLRGLDVRAIGGYFLVAPSLHISGARYQWREGHTEPAEMPDWLRTLLERKPSKPTTQQPVRMFQPPRDVNETGAYWLTRALHLAREGNRNAKGFWLACQLRDAGLSQEQAEHFMVDYAARVPGVDYPEREALNSLRQAYQTPAREPARSLIETVKPPADYHKNYSTDDSKISEDRRNYTSEAPAEDAPTGASQHRTDMGNARRFVAKQQGDARYIAQWGQWLLWDGTRYQRDLTDAVVRRGKATVSHIYQEAADSDDTEERRELAKWALKSESESRLRAMLKLAESEPEIATSPEMLDADQWRINARNGTIDLHTGALLPHDRAHLITKRTEASYDPSARCPTWLAFLNTIFDGDADLIAYIQRAVGYSLTGDTREQCVFVGHGGGANGKSTFIDTICRVLGDYAMTTPTDTLMAKNGQTIPSDVARLVGARFVAASESGEGRRLDEELVKRISGGDRMAARFMHKDWFEFTPVLKMWLAVNHEPTIRGTDNGIWRRIHLIPFTVTLTPERQDKRMPAKLLAERDGILAWAVQGCLNWQQSELRPPEKVQKATQDYRARMDTFGLFLDECCASGTHERVANKALRQRYEEWCDENGERPIAQIRFSRQLRERGYASGRSDSSGATIWHGISIKPAIM